MSQRTKLYARQNPGASQFRGYNYLFGTTQLLNYRAPLPRQIFSMEYLYYGIDMQDANVLSGRVCIVGFGHQYVNLTGQPSNLGLVSSQVREWRLNVTVYGGAWPSEQKITGGAFTPSEDTGWEIIGPGASISINDLYLITPATARADFFWIDLPQIRDIGFPYARYAIQWVGPKPNDVVPGTSTRILQKKVGAGSGVATNLTAAANDWASTDPTADNYVWSPYRPFINAMVSVTAETADARNP